VKENDMTTTRLNLLLATAALTLGAAAAHAQGVQDATTGGDYCREYQQTLTIAGKTQKGYGMACLQEDGSWELRNSEPAPVEVGAPVPAPNMEYYVEESHVYVTPPEPFVVGTVFIDGHRHHFDRDFRPSWHGGYHHWH
jgi:hypothetical protein